YNTAHSTSYVFGYDAFKTIQNGINGVSAGGQVLVESGTYVENVIVTKSVSLDGAGQATCTVIPAISGPNTATGSSLPPGHSTIMLIQANNVTISGFTLDGDNPALTSAYNVGGANLDARNGVITNHPMGVFTNLTVHDVTIKNIYLRGIYASSGGSFNFHDNIVTNVQAEGASIGMFNFGGSGIFANNTVSYCGDAISSNWSTGTKYLNNTISYSGSAVHTDNNGGYGGSADTIRGNVAFNSLTNGYGFWVFFPYLIPVVENNSVTNFDVGLFVWGSANATGSAIFAGNTVDAQHKAGSVASMVTTGQAAWYYAADARATFNGNTLKNADYGFYSEELEGFNTAVALNGNKYLGNGEGLENAGAALNVQNNAFGNIVNALDNTAANYYNANCWSDYSGTGPYAIGGGGGNQDLAPGSDCGLNMTPENILYLCGGNFTFTVSVGDIVQNLDAADLRFEFPAELGVVSIAPASGNFFLTHTQTANAAGQKDTLKINLGVLTGSLNGPADLFTVTMNGSSVCSPSQIAMIYRDLRDNSNSAITVPLALPSTFKSDCIDPTIVVNSPAPGGFYITSPSLNLSAADNCDLSAVYYQIDGCSPTWSAIATGLSGTTYSNAAWTIPGFGALTDGSHCLRFKVIDQNTRGNADSCTTTWCFTKDTQAPAPPTNFVAKPGHNNVKLTWTNSVSSDVVGVRIQRVPWTDYPNFGSQPTPTAAPAYPANQTIGTNVLDSAATANAAVAHKDVSGLSNATRDIYYYAAFAYDAAGNYSVSAVSAQGRSTSYWLGDLTDNTFSPTAYDGNVYVQDLALFSVAYGTKQGDPAFSAYADFGPAVGGSPKGIPLPDDSVQFEDLVIFAINFDAVSPIAKTVPIFADQSVNGSLTLALTPTVANGVTTYHLNLVNNPGDLKALRAVIDLGEGALLQNAQISPSLTNGVDPVFAKVITQGHRVTIDAAILGTGKTIGGSGELATLTVTNADKAQIVEADLRNGENSALAVTVSSPAAEMIPGQYALGQNYPNPFNPTTQISYDLPVAGYARLEIFNLLGRRVAVIVDAFQQAGSHTVEWNSKDDAGHAVSSGIYLYRLTVNDYSSTRKMLLMK
ncbi:MAG: T9SS type A sorting domain-containing protein, partial [Candidatus Zixiibacteriota bacterium]